MFSIIIPVFNSEKYLENCIISVLNQTYKNFELLLINDGSTDNSAEICEKFANEDNRIKVIHQPNRGVSSARNKGIDNATGDYITFVDSDDVVISEWLEIVNIELDKNNLDMLTYRFSQNNIIDNPEIKSFTALNSSDLKYKFNDILVVSMGSVCTNIYKREIINNNQIKFNNDIALNEEIFFNFKILENIKSLRFIDKVLYYYTANETSSSRKGDVNYLNIVREKVEVYAEFLEKMNYNDNVEYSPNDMLVDGTFLYFLQSAVSTNTLSYSQRIMILKNIYENSENYTNLMNSNQFKINSLNLLICKISAILKIPFIIAMPVTIKKYFNKRG